MKQNAGFTLIEVLITVVILASGLLGLAGLQATGLKYNQSAYNRTQAVQLAYDMADRIRANNRVADKYKVTPAQLSAKTCPTEGSSQCNACSSSANPCNEEDLAKKDLYDWKLALANTLPGGAEGSVSVNGSTCTVRVSWDDNRNGAIDGDDSYFSVNFQL